MPEVFIFLIPKINASTSETVQGLPVAGFTVQSYVKLT